MANTTNFGWETPDDTDLVKDGAAAMRTLGNAIDASLVDLKGGTSGQVLSKNSNTDMDFTWVTTDDADAIQNSIVDAKGDLIAASAADTPARLAVGNNGETLVADSSATTGLRWQANSSGGKNYIINGGFDFWARGTSTTTTAGGYYTADRFYTAGGGTVTFSQQTDVPTGVNSQYSLRWLTGAATSYGQVYQALESGVVKALRGQNVVFSYYIKSAGSHTGNIQTEIKYSNSTDALTSATTTVTATGDTSYAASGVTSWTRKYVTFTIPTDAVGLRIGIVPDTTQASGVSELMTGFQLEIGSVPTMYSRAGGTLAGELAACQRYYWRTSGTGTNIVLPVFVFNATNAYGVVRHPVQMRIAPTLGTDGSTANHKFYVGGTSYSVTSGPTQDTSTQDSMSIGYPYSTGGLTAGQAGYAFVQSGSYLEFKAEL